MTNFELLQIKKEKWFQPDHDYDCSERWKAILKNEKGYDMYEKYHYTSSILNFHMILSKNKNCVEYCLDFFIFQYTLPKSIQEHVYYKRYAERSPIFVGSEKEVSQHLKKQTENLFSKEVEANRFVSQTL